MERQPAAPKRDCLPGLECPPSLIISALMNAAPHDPLASPCIRNCCLDEGNVCMGCGRSLQEIVAWGTATDADKAAILERSRERSKRRAQGSLRAR
jgi:predicted Fe-S protein YdhL (DUF1289 family)